MQQWRQVASEHKRSADRGRVLRFIVYIHAVCFAVCWLHRCDSGWTYGFITAECGLLCGSFASNGCSLYWEEIHGCHAVSTHTLRYTPYCRPSTVSPSAVEREPHSWVFVRLPCVQWSEVWRFMCVLFFQTQRQQACPVWRLWWTCGVGHRVLDVQWFFTGL